MEERIRRRPVESIFKGKGLIGCDFSRCKEMEMEYPESIRSRMFDWYDGPPLLNNRLEPKIKDVSPCSEYTRYTVEGILEDPRSELSAVLDVEAIGHIFINSDLKDPKWSSRLGYGMAVVGEDTRIHIHRNGKYIIRRALDREHAESTYNKIVNLIKPALYDTENERYLWDQIREILTDKTNMERAAPFLRWPEGEGDIQEMIAKIREGAQEVDRALLNPIRDALLQGRKDDLGSLMGRVDEMTRSFTESLLDDVDVSLGRLSALIWARTSITMIAEPVKIDLERNAGWDSMVEDHLGSETNTLQILVSRLHYLLSPVD